MEFITNNEDKIVQYFNEDDKKILDKLKFTDECNSQMVCNLESVLHESIFTLMQLVERGDGQERFTHREKKQLQMVMTAYMFIFSFCILGITSFELWQALKEGISRENNTAVILLIFIKIFFFIIVVSQIVKELRQIEYRNYYGKTVIAPTVKIWKWELKISLDWVQ